VDDEEAVATYLRTRDPDVFRLLLERHQARVFRLVAGVLGPFADLEAQDVTQEVFIRMHERLPSFRGESRFSTWLYRLAYNRTIEHRRLARFRRPHLPIDELASRRNPEGPHEAAAEGERTRLVEALVERLPDVYRAVVYLHYWLELPVEEIGEMIGTPAGTVKSYLFRARQCLRGRAKALGFEGLE
jgi:RNA polymerase sigma-70 factor (ECF subfamily)